MERSPNRQKMKEPPEAMRGWADGLAREIAEWPEVTLKRAFGMTLVYRGETVFAALPATRSLYAEDAILLKFLEEPPAIARRIAAEKRFAMGTMEQQRTATPKSRSAKPKTGGEGRKWRIFVMREDADVHAALSWMEEAYRLASAARS